MRTACSGAVRTFVSFTGSVAWWYRQYFDLGVGSKTSRSTTSSTAADIGCPSRESPFRAPLITSFSSSASSTNISLSLLSCATTSAQPSSTLPLWPISTLSRSSTSAAARASMTFAGVQDWRAESND
ncbi:hypothetical protein [Saccharopolyspora shandongensis]|uniref:hypothetical protein n=1 Tax=Saccharopolyspora shandongensis TaxID=418495 RepID=UPI00340C7004